MNFGNLHLLADGKTGTKQMCSSVEKADEPTADIAEKAKNPNTDTNQAKAQQTKQRRLKTQTQARTKKRHNRCSK